jgi:ribosomal protein L9
MSDKGSLEGELQSKSETEETFKETEEAPTEKLKFTSRGIEKPHKVEISPTKGIFKTPPVMKTKRPQALDLVIPNLKSRTSIFAKPKLIPIRVKATPIVIPKIFTREWKEEYKVPILEPLAISKLFPLYPKLKLEQPIDVSVRPVIYQKVTMVLKPLRPMIRVFHIPVPRPHLISAFISQPMALCKPKIRANGLGLEKEVEKAVYKLKLMGFLVEDISKCMNMAYNISLSSEKILEIVERGNEGKIELIPLLPKEVSDAFDKLIKEKQEMVIETPKLVTKPEAEEGIEVSKEDLLDELFPPAKGNGIHKWRSHMRPICLLVTGDSFDSREMLEDIVSTKYTFHGEYGFPKNLTCQVKSKEVEIALQQRVRSAEEIIKERMREKPSIYEKIISKDLIVSDKVTENDKDGIVKGLRDVADRGPKCVILYSDKLEPFLYLDKEVGANIDVKFVRLPIYNERTLLLIGKLIGIEPKASSPSIKVAWADSIRYYEKVMRLLNEKLSYNLIEVPRDTENETELHYIMKKVVYHILKQKHKNVVAEKEIFETDVNGKRVQIKPDIRVDEAEFWEIETGYPTDEEKECLSEYFKPHVRLIEKLKKFGEGKVNLVVQSIYASLFMDELRKVKDAFKGIIELKFYMLHWSETEPKLRQFL